MSLLFLPISLILLYSTIILFSCHKKKKRTHSLQGPQSLIHFYYLVVLPWTKDDFKLVSSLIYQQLPSPSRTGYSNQEHITNQNQPFPPFSHSHGSNSHTGREQCSIIFYQPLFHLHPQVLGPNSKASLFQINVSNFFIHISNSVL